MDIRELREALAKLNAEERTLRTEGLHALAKAREADNTLTDEAKERGDEITAEIAALDTKRVKLQAELVHAEKLADLERNAVVEPRIETHENVLDDPKRGFKSFGEFCLEILDCGPGAHGIRSNQRLMAAAGTGMQQGVREDGGVLIPPAYSTDIWDGARTQSDSLLQYCDVVPIDAGVQSVTFPAINETSRADGSRWGGIRGYWKDELTQLTSSTPKFRDVKIEPEELYVFAYIADKLLRHAPGAASAVLMRGAADEINFKTGAAIFAGDGVGKPLGFYNAAYVVSVAKETGQAATTIVRENIDKMWTRCHARWRSSAVWFINQDTEPQLEQLAANVGTGGVPIYLPAGGITDTPNARLKGRPVVPIEYCKTLGTVGDIVLANLSSYRVGLRAGIDQKESMHLKFDYAQTAFRFIFEIDGQPMLASALTPFQGTSNTLSPVVTLATRSS